jgi:hypothetical protein
MNVEEKVPEERGEVEERKHGRSWSFNRAYCVRSKKPKKRRLQRNLDESVPTRPVETVGGVQIEQRRHESENGPYCVQ